MVQVIIHQTVALVGAVMERNSTIVYVYVYCQSSKVEQQQHVFSYSLWLPNE
jgi:hypothetical protein